MIVLWAKRAGAPKDPNASTRSAHASVMTDKAGLAVVVVIAHRLTLIVETRTLTVMVVGTALDVVEVAGEAEAVVVEEEAGLTQDESVMLAGELEAGDALATTEAEGVGHHLHHPDECLGHRREEDGEEVTEAVGLRPPLVLAPVLVHPGRHLEPHHRHDVVDSVLRLVQ